MSAEILRATFAVEVHRVELVTDETVQRIVALANSPRPGRVYALRDLRDQYRVEVIYPGYPDAPAFPVDYHDIARAWAELASAGEANRDPAHCSLIEAIRVVDRACAHIPNPTPRRTS